MSCECSIPVGQRDHQSLARMQMMGQLASRSAHTEHVRLDRVLHVARKPGKVRGKLIRRNTEQSGGSAILAIVLLALSAGERRKREVVRHERALKQGREYPRECIDVVRLIVRSSGEAARGIGQSAADGLVHTVQTSGGS